MESKSIIFAVIKSNATRHVPETLCEVCGSVLKCSGRYGMAQFQGRQHGRNIKGGKYADEMNQVEVYR